MFYNYFSFLKNGRQMATFNVDVFYTFILLISENHQKTDGKVDLITTSV